MSSQFTPCHAAIQEPQLWLLEDLLRRILWKWLNFLMLLWSWPLRSRLRPKVWWFSSYEFLNTSVPLIIYYILKISQCYLRALVSNKHRNKVEGLCGNFEFRLQNSIWDCQAKAGRWGLCKTISYYWFRERNNEIQGLSWDLVLRYFCCPTLLPKTGVSVVYFCLYHNVKSRIQNIGSIYLSKRMWGFLFLTFWNFAFTGSFLTVYMPHDFLEEYIMC